MRTALAIVMGLAGPVGAIAQAPAFEAVSIKPADPSRRGAGSGANDARVSYSAANLTFLLIRAFDVKNYQIDGIDKDSLQFYSIEAKLPEGATPDQVPAMLQTMLADRFELKYHRESRIEPVLALVVDKNGAKIPKADEKSRKGISFGGNGHLEFHRQTMAEVARSLSVDLGKPVLDVTNLEGEFEFKMDVDPLDLPGLIILRAPGGDAPPSSNPSIQSALAAFGLKLEARKAPIEHIVVDSVRKTPTEN